VISPQAPSAFAEIEPTVREHVMRGAVNAPDPNTSHLVNAGPVARESVVVEPAHSNLAFDS